jgi:Bacterial protein of unknown function (DUF916)
VKLAQKAGAALAASLLALGTVAALSAPSQAADNGTWSVTPISKGQQAPRQFFFFEVSEGQALRDAVTIKNNSDIDQALTVYPADAFNVTEGAGFGLRPLGEPNNDVGSWITIPENKRRVNLAPGSSVNVPFTMRVPTGTTPGDHVGGIVTVEPAPPAVGDTSQVVTRRAIGVRIYARVAGPLTPSLNVESVRIDAVPARLPFIGRQGGAVVTYTVRNSGNVRLTVDRVITIKGLFGRTLHNTGSGPIPEILPGSTVTLSESFTGMPVLDQVTARVELSEPRNDISTAGDDVVWVVSVIFLVMVLVLLLCLAFAIWWSQRRGDEQDEIPGVPETGQVVGP